jgi:hypothetical protein
MVETEAALRCRFGATADEPHAGAAGHAPTGADRHGVATGRTRAAEASTRAFADEGEAMCGDTTEENEDRP